jgi:invasion protein IalB
MPPRRERVDSTMANCTLQVARGGIGHVGAAALALALGVAGLMGPAAAQQPAPAPAPPPAAKKAPAAAPAQKGAPAAAAPAAAQSAWVKLCEKATAVGKDKDGKEEKRDINICLTHHERLDGNTGMVLVSAAVRQVEGQDKQHFMVMVPLGMLIQPGMRASIYPKDLWELAQKNEKVDEAKLKGLKLGFTLCHPAGCTAELEAPADLIADLKTAGGLVIFSINAGGQPVGFPIPLTGFEQAYAGAPVDNKQYGEARKALMQQIAQRQQEMAEEQRKQQAAGQAPGAAPPAAGPAKAAGPAPAPKK